MKILLDTRESIFIDKMQKWFGDNIELVKLDVGDIVIGDIVIERKRASDLVNRLVNNTLWEQLSALNSINGVLLIYDLFSYYNRELLNRILATIITSFPNIRIIMCLTDDDLKILLKTMYNKLSKEKVSSKPIIFKKKGRSDREVIEDMLTALPSMGRKRANKLIDALGGLKNIINADYNTLSDILGKKVANKIYHIFNWDKE